MNAHFLSAAEPPTNDKCNGAIELKVGSTYVDNVVSSSNVDATTTPNLKVPDCAYRGSDPKDVWFYLTVPESGRITIETRSGSDSSEDLSLRITAYKGTCGSFEEISCAGPVYATRYTALILEDRTPGEKVYLRVWEYYSRYKGSFSISAYSDNSRKCKYAKELQVGANFEDNIVTSTNTLVFVRNDSAPYCSNNQERGTLWYKVKVPASGRLAVETKAINSDTDLMMQVFSGSCESLTKIECIDDRVNKFPLTVLNNRTPNEQLYIRVWDKEGIKDGQFKISAYQYTPVTNDDVNNAKEVTIARSIEEGTLDANNKFARDSGLKEEECGYKGNDLWYKFKVPNTGNFTVKAINSLGASQDIVYKIFSGTPGNLKPLDTKCASGDKYTGRTPQETLYIRVWDYQNNGLGNFQLAFYDDTPLNNLCTASIDLEVGKNFDDKTKIVDANEATKTVMSVPSCTADSYVKRDLWYKVIVPASGAFVIETKELKSDETPYTSNDTGLAVYSGGCNGLNIVGCDEDKGDERFSLLVIKDRTPNEELYVRVWNRESEGNTEDFKIAAYEFTLENDECDTATNLVPGRSFETSAVVVDNRYATKSDQTSNCSEEIRDDLWFKVAIPNTGNLTIETAKVNGPLGIQLAVYKGTCGNLEDVACGYGGSNAFEKIQLKDKKPGDEYYVRVAQKYRDNVGTFKIAAYDTTILNDLCYGAINLKVGNRYHHTGSVFVKNKGARDSKVSQPSCGNYKGGDVWYKIRVPSSGNFTVETRAAENFKADNANFAIYKGNCENLEELFCANNDVNFPELRVVKQTPNEELYIRLWRDGGNTDSNWFEISVYDATPANDESEGAIALKLGKNFEENQVVANVFHATTSEVTSSCDFEESKDLWYTTKVPSSGNLAIETRTNSDKVENTSLAIYTKKGNDFTEITCIDDKPINQFSIVFLNNRPVGEELYIKAMVPNTRKTGSFAISAFEVVAPVNNLCDVLTTRLLVGSNFDANVTTGSNFGALDSGVEAPQCGNYKGGDVWYKLAVPSSGNVVIETKSNGQIKDTAMEVYSGNCDSLVKIECNDNSGDEEFSRVKLSRRKAGETLYVRVWEPGNDQYGTFKISAYKFTPTYSDYCDNASLLSVGTSFASYSKTVSNVNATTSNVPMPSCGDYQGNDVWYRVNVPSSGKFALETKSASTDVTNTGIAVYSGSCTSGLKEIACNNNKGADDFSLLTLKRTAGETLYVRVWVNGEQQFGNFKIAAYNIETPFNDVCNEAVVMTTGTKASDYPKTVNNVGVFDSGFTNPNCGSYNGKDSWYIARVPASGNIRIETSSSGGVKNTALAVYKGKRCDGLELISCADKQDGFSVITLTERQAGETLFIRTWVPANVNYGTYNIASYDPDPSTLSANSVNDVKDQLLCYPNPVKNTLNIESNKEVDKVEVYTITGKLVILTSKLKDAKKLDVSGLASGIYLVKVFVNNTSKIVRVIKQ